MQQAMTQNDSANLDSALCRNRDVDGAVSGVSVNVCAYALASVCGSRRRVVFPMTTSNGLFAFLFCFKKIKAHL